MHKNHALKIIISSRRSSSYLTCFLTGRHFVNKMKTIYHAYKNSGPADYVAGFTATGSVNKHDYDTILVPAPESLDKQHGHIHFLMVLETPVKNFSLGAWLEDAWMGLKHFRGWKR